MKRPIITMILLGLLSGTSVLCWDALAEAANSSVEAGLQSFGDLSMFYQALLNTGVINEINEGQHYTIFAPVNSAFAMIPRQTYPCFYSEQCRPQIAALLRDHIIIGRYDLSDLVTYGSGIQTGGTRRVHIGEPYVADYAVEDQKILSQSEINGNMIYRISGVITSPQELAQFQTASVIPANSVTMEKTIIQKTQPSSLATPNAYPAGSMGPGGADDESETITTITHTYTQPE